VPLEDVWYLRPAELERLVCGRPDFDADELRKRARFESIDAADPRIDDFFAVLASLSARERAMFTRFVSGRERSSPDVRLKIIGAPPAPTQAEEDTRLPTASTCFYWIALPKYSSRELLRERLLYAIHHCLEIDADFRARDADIVTPPRMTRARVDDAADFEDYSHLL
jgi:E3 ubiquitin-protein ligase HERC2